MVAIDWVRTMRCLPFIEDGCPVHLGRLLRTVFLCDYFLNDVSRRELLRGSANGGICQASVETYKMTFYFSRNVKSGSAETRDRPFQVSHL